MEVLKKQELEKMCDKCHRKMSVKFDFNKMETEGDPEAWVVFNCSMCATPECQYEDDSGSVLSICILKDSLINSKSMTHFIYHSSEIKDSRSTKCCSKTLQNLLYFMYKKTHVVFFVFHFMQLYVFTL